MQNKCLCKILILSEKKIVTGENQINQAILNRQKSMNFCKLYEPAANYQRIIRYDLADNSLIIHCRFIQRIKGAVNRHFVFFVCFTLIRCADNSPYELNLSRLFVLVSYYGHNINYILVLHANRPSLLPLESHILTSFYQCNSYTEERLNEAYLDITFQRIFC